MINVEDPALSNEGDVSQRIRDLGAVKIADDLDDDETGRVGSTSSVWSSAQPTITTLIGPYGPCGVPLASRAAGFAGPAVPDSRTSSSARPSCTSMDICLGR